MPVALVVDDNDDVRELISQVLAEVGVRSIPAASGAEALDLLHADTKTIDLVVLDVQLPVLDGWEALRAIRADLDTSRIPVIMCTVRSSASDRLRGWELGCDGYLTKPFDIDELRGEVRSVLAMGPNERSRLRRTRIRQESEPAD